MRTALVALFACGCATTAADNAREEPAQLTDGTLATPACLPKLECDAPTLPFVPRAWRHASSSFISRIGDAHHRGRDFFVTPGAPQTIIGKLAYGPNDKDLEDEEVDLFVQADCASGWEKIGTAVTTEDGAHATVEGVVDDGGRVYFEIPSTRRLGPGRHRIRLVVGGDGTFADSFIDVVPPATKIFISDVDGTLTSSEEVEAAAMLVGFTPETHASAPEALRALAAKGYRPMYLTARPEILTERTREFLAERGFPPGVLHTSARTTGSGFGAAAAEAKTSEMALLAAKGLVPTFGFGNKPSDADAYASIPVEGNRIFYRIEGTFTGKRIESYAELLPSFDALPAVCK